MFNLEHIKRPLLSAWDTSARFLSMFQLLDAILFCTWLGYSVAMPRKLVWIEKQDFQGFGCSECNWKFSASGTLAGDSLDEMKRKYAVERDKEFAAHTCVKHTNPTDRETK